MSVEKSKLPEAVHLKFPGGYCRPVEIGDAPYIYVWVNDPDIRPFLNRHVVEMLADEEEWIKGLSKEKEHQHVWMICLTDGARVGTIGLHNIDLKNGTATSGAMFGTKEHQSKGVGQKAKHVILNHAFNGLNLRQIYSNVLSFNERSIQYNIKCGYRELVRLPNDVKMGDQFYDCVMMMVTRDSWLPIWEKFRKEHQIESFEEMLERTMKPRKKE
ncbi:MAG: GNAT family N-acetyltransferase [Patescibacteria group bacterium]